MSGIDVRGAQTLFQIGPVAITETILSIIVVTTLLAVAGVLLGRNLKKRPGALQVLTEKGVGMLMNLVSGTMGEHNIGWTPYIGTIFLSSLAGSLIGMTGFLRSATSDLSTTLTWALMTSVLVWVCSIRANGVWGWLKGYAEPVAVMLPMNIVSEIAQPISMAFRHFGNIMGGGVLTSLLYSALAAASSLIFGWLPGLLGEIPFLQVGIPAVLSLYFDIFSGFVQALVFSLLTMVYVGNACPPPEIE